MRIIGIDSGSTIIKLIEVDEGYNITNKMFLEKIPIKEALDKFVGGNNIDLSNISKIVLTGVGSSDVQEDSIYNIKIEKVDEFIAIANGGRYLTKKDKALVISVGTGTAFVRADGDNIKHIGGSGVGRRNTFKHV